MVAAVWGGTVPLLIVLYLLLLVPQNRRLRQLQVELEEKKLAFTGAEAAATEQARAERNQRIDKLRQKLGTFVAEPDQLDELTFSIRRIATEAQVEGFAIKEGMRSSYLAPMPDGEHIAHGSTNIAFASTFDRFASLVNSLERHRPVVFVEELTISIPPQTAALPQVEMVLTFFVRKPAQDKTGAGAAKEGSSVISDFSSPSKSGSLK